MQIDKLTLSYKQSIAWKFLTEKNGVEEVFMGGAAGPGKTFLGCLWQITNRLNHPGTRGALCRKTRKSLVDTTLETFFTVCGLLGLEPDVDYKYNSIKGRITFDNGSFIYLVEMAHKPTDPDYHRFGSLELTDVFGDEVAECPKKSVEIISSRIRHELINGEPKALWTSNPSNNWAKLKWISNKQNVPVTLEPDVRVVRALLSDNPDPVFREAYKKRLMRLPPYQRARLLDGNWEVTENEQPFFNFKLKNVNQTALVGKMGAFNSEPLWLSFDFNVDPTVCIVAQKINHPTKGGIRIFKEHTVKGGTEALCNEILKAGYHHRAGPMFIAGDFSGNTRNTAAKNTDYEIIQKMLRLPLAYFKDTRTANKDHVYSRAICQYILEHIPLRIEESECPELIMDLKIAQATDDGKLRKDRETFKMDHADAYRYLMDAWFPQGIGDIDIFAHQLGIFEEIY